MALKVPSHAIGKMVKVTRVEKAKTALKTAYKTLEKRGVITAAGKISRTAGAIGSAAVGVILLSDAISAITTHPDYDPRGTNPAKDEKVEHTLNEYFNESQSNEFEKRISEIEGGTDPMTHQEALSSATDALYNQYLSDQANTYYWYGGSFASGLISGAVLRRM